MTPDPSIEGNASDVLREGLHLVEQRERFEGHSRKALRKAAHLGWADVSAGRYVDIPDDQLEDFIGQLGLRAARVSKTQSRAFPAAQ